MGKLDLESKASDATAQFVIVGEEVRDGVKSANSIEVHASKNHGRAQGKAQAAFQLARDHHAAEEVRADAQRFQPRSQSFRRDPAIEASHQTDPRIRKWRGHPPKIAALDANVAIVHQQHGMTRHARHLFKIADLYVGAKHLPAYHKLDRKIGELLL